MKKKLLIPLFLTAMAIPCLSNGFNGVSADAIGEYTDKTAYIKYGSAINDQLADEGFVLLKNKDGFLPLAPQGKKISVVGKSSTNLARGGAGSGSGSVSSGVTSIDLQESLTKVGYTLNGNLTSFYKGSSSGSGRTNGNDGWKGNSEVTIGETPMSSYSSSLLASLDEYNDAIIQVITREGSEGCDVKTCNAHDSKKTNSSAEQVSDRHALQLSENEEALFNEAKKHSDNIIFVINSSNIFQCNQLENDDKVKAILWIGNPGDRGPGAVGRILSGEVNPSGRTVDTWARDFTLDPTFQNFSDNAQTNLVTSKSGKKYYAPQDTMIAADGKPMLSYGTDKAYSKHSSPRWDSARGGEEFGVVSGGINGVKPAAYVSYEEGIYVDYRYYETRYADMAKADKAAADAWYNGQHGVIFPFGYGLSYTTFTQKIVKSNVAKNSTINQGREVISVTVEVENTGTVAGKDVVQLYWKAPYTSGGIEKADHVLCAFDKTKVLQPGQKQQISLSFYMQDVANYDFSDANKNGFCGYELDCGDYALFLAKNAHEAYEEWGFKIANGEDKSIKFKKDRFTGEYVVNRFTDRGFYSSMPGKDDIEFTQMSRANFEATFPTHPTMETRKVKEGSRFEEFLTHEFSIKEVEVDMNFDYVAPGAYRNKGHALEGKWEQQPKALAKSKRTQLSKMRDVDFNDDEAWNKFINEFTYAEMLKYIEENRMSSPSQDNIGKPSFSEGDGPQKFNIMWWVSSPIIAATYNPDLAHKQGECVGMESHISGKSGWWGPAVNTHRSPFGGRNFEYYSADPFLMGRMAAQVVGAATDRGVYAYFKHFATNDQEKNRESGISFLTEQALREIYLKSFQMVFEEGKSIGVMGSYNRLGLMETAASYPLLTEVLRGEWGFKGAVLSDMTHSGNGSVNFKCYECVTNRALSGCNSQLDSGGFKNQTNAIKWDKDAFDGKGAPVASYKNSKGETVKYECYSWWNACRTITKEIMYMSVHCTAMNNTIVKVAEGNEAYVEHEARTDFNYTLPAGAKYQLNERVDLPRGVTFDPATGKLSGKIELEGTYHLDFLIVSDSGKVTGAYKLILTATTGAVKTDYAYIEEEPDAPAPVAPTPYVPPKKGGCGGDISAVYAIAGMIVLAGIGIALLSFTRRKREEA